MQSEFNVVFISNYYNHHQSETSRFFSDYSKSYFFIECEPIDFERIKMGWGESKPDFLIQAWKTDDDYKRAVQCIKNADVIIIGAGDYSLLKYSNKDQLVFGYNERIFKCFLNKLEAPLRMIYYKKKFANVKYMLCASGFACRDFNLIGYFKNRCFKWGYFPKIYNCTSDIFNKKEENSIICVNRLIKLKQQILVLKSFNICIKHGYLCKLTIVGNGPESKRIIKYIKKKQLTSFVNIIDSLPVEKVKEEMAKNSIFILASNFKEGWGAVVNEAMSAGCACVVSSSVGAAPFLIKNYDNGLLFKTKSKKSLVKKIEFLLENKDIRLKIQKRAVETINNEWSAENAVKNFFKLVRILKSNCGNISEGPCSVSLPLKNNYYNE